MSGDVPILRLATPEDADAIDVLMKASTRDLFPMFYSPEQTASSIRFVAHVDRMLIEDGTYFVLEWARECGLRGFLVARTDDETFDAAVTRTFAEVARALDQR